MGKLDSPSKKVMNMDVTGSFFIQRTVVEHFYAIDTVLCVGDLPVTKQKRDIYLMSTNNSNIHERINSNLPVYCYIHTTNQNVYHQIVSQ